MRLKRNQPAPSFHVQNVLGYEIDTKDLLGHQVYIAFERNAGCPVCHLRTHELLKQVDFFKSNKIVVVMIYESTAEKMREYLGTGSYPFHFVADPENTLYDLFGVERS